MVIGHVRRFQYGITDRPVENQEEEHYNERHLLKDFRHRSKDEVDHKQANGCTGHRFKLIGGEGYREASVDPCYCIVKGKYTKRLILL